MTPVQRKTLLFAAFAGVAVLAWFAPEPAQVPVSSGKAGQRVDSTVSKNARTNTTSAGKALPFDTTLPTRDALGKSSDDIFAVRSWMPPPKPEPPPPSPAPVPPANPFRFAGRLMQDGQAQTYLAKGDVTIPIKVGEVLDGVYRIDEVSFTRVAMTYIPLAHKEVIIFDAPANTTGAVAVPSAMPSDSSASGPTATVARARVTWNGPVLAKAGTQFSVALRVFSEQPLGGSPLQMRFNPKILQFVSVRPGKIYSANAGRGFNSRVNADGTIFVVAAAHSAPSSGDLELLEVTFRPLKLGVTAEVILNSLNLQGADGRTLAHEGPGAFRIAVAPN